MFKGEFDHLLYFPACCLSVCSGISAVKCPLAWLNLDSPRPLTELSGLLVRAQVYCDLCGHRERDTVALDSRGRGMDHTERLASARR